MDFYLKTVPKSTQAVLESLKKVSEIQTFYLSGGTALSLLLGHRESEDLDFFSKTEFQPQVLQQKLLQCGVLENVQIAEGTLNLYINKVKLQFLHYPYDLLEDLTQWKGIYLSSVTDIACTKLITISMRGSKKDFVDLYFILQKMSLEELFEKLEEKYHDVHYNYPHILKSLVYFEDANLQPMPRMHISVDWEQVKVFILQQVKKFTF
ncbi:MAG TPA: nucleotidyl transferase AbiEii/AbiGii toxin family protein [Xanthomonadales bacterium]|nr:nucleotidyl transferase AbiEii/AbiGii toxin family protein [Xanthomonadales bacterium]